MRALLFCLLAGGMLFGCNAEQPASELEPQRVVQTALWTVDDLEELGSGEPRSLPPLQQEVPLLLEDHYTWDFWPLYTPDGDLAEVNGYKIMFSLSAPRTMAPTARHNVARIRYYYSADDGETWLNGGELFPEEDSIGSRQWTGSSIYYPDREEMIVFYTATGNKENIDGKDISYKQKIAKTSARISKSYSDGISFTQWADHRVILEPDHELYAEFEGFDNHGIVTTFRDPFYFKDPRSGEEYILFSGRHRTEANYFNGCLGLARLNADGGWELLPPIIKSAGVDAEMEVGQMLYEDDKYYVLFTSQATAFAPGIEAPTGLYGFVSDDLIGPYRPMNGSGLIVANPPNQPFKFHAFRVLPNGKTLSFLNYGGERNPYEQSSEWRKQHVFATLAPPLQLSLEGDRSHFRASWPFDH